MRIGNTINSGMIDCTDRLNLDLNVSSEIAASVLVPIVVEIEHMRLKYIGRPITRLAVSRTRSIYVALN